MAYGNHRSCASCGSTGKAALITPKLFYNLTKRHKICSTQPHVPDKAPRFHLHNQLIDSAKVWRITCGQISDVFQKEAKQFLQEQGWGQSSGLSPERSRGTARPAPCAPAPGGARASGPAKGACDPRQARGQRAQGLGAASAGGQRLSPRPGARRPGAKEDEARS